MEKSSSVQQDPLTQESQREMKLPPISLPANLTFGPFPITTSQAFHISPSRLTYALVNLRPLLPGHTLICPVRCVPRLSKLTDNETTDLFLTVKHVSAMLERVYKADALNVAVQDGVEAGQSVPHVHVHLIPRRRSDVASDEIYERMDGKEGNLGTAYEEMQRRRREREEMLEKQTEREFKEDWQRSNRTEGEMRKEAEWFRWEMERQGEVKDRKDDDGERSGQFP